MAKSENNEVMFGARGRVGNLVVFKNFGNNQTVIARRPKKVENPVYTAKQLQVKLKFKKAVIYAKGIMKNDLLLAYYAKYAKPGISAYNMALADFCKSPEIELVDVSNYNGTIGDQISVTATDNFEVVSVMVFIIDALGDIIESGLAELSDNSIDWIYTATTTNGAIQGNTIKAEATDMPGNKTTVEINLV